MNTHYLLALSLLLAACSSPEPAAPPAVHDHSQHAMQRDDSVDTSGVPEGHWYCPMHPEETSPTKGRCGKCNMELVQKPRG